MKATIRPFEPLYLQRIAQLTNKSNQFNLTTLRCSEEDIRAMSTDPAWLCLYGKLEDRFGDNGVVTVVAGQQEGALLHLRLWLMSCRVLKRGMEDAMMDAVVADAAARGVKTICGYYYPTAKMQWSKNFTPRWALPGSKRTKTAIRSGIWMLRHIRYAILTWKFCGEGRLSPSGGRKDGPKGLDYSRSSPFGHVLGNTCRMAKNLIQAEISKICMQFCK